MWLNSFLKNIIILKGVINNGLDEFIVIVDILLLIKWCVCVKLVFMLFFDFNLWCVVCGNCWDFNWYFYCLL